MLNWFVSASFKLFVVYGESRFIRLSLSESLLIMSIGVPMSGLMQVFGMLFSRVMSLSRRVAYMS